MNCLICNANNFSYLYNYTLKKCNVCGFITANIEISAEELSHIYTEKYFKGEEYLDYLKEKQALQFNFRRRLKCLRRVFPEKKINNVLEIGCAYGFFGNVLTDIYSDSKYIGIDLAHEPILYGKQVLNLNLVEADYLLYNSSEKYSDVFMWDVIEHLERPDLFLRKVHSELAENGFVYLTTGDIGSFFARIQKERWRMIHPPSHLQYFSEKTLIRLLEKEGFNVAFIKYPAVYRSIKQMFFSLFILKKKKRKLLNVIFNAIPEKWLIPLNTYDIMFVCAQRK